MKIEFQNDDVQRVLLTRTRRHWPRFWHKTIECAMAVWLPKTTRNGGLYVYKISGESVEGSFDGFALGHNGLQRKLISARDKFLEKKKRRDYVPPPPLPSPWIPLGELPKAKLLKP